MVLMPRSGCNFVPDPFGKPCELSLFSPCVNHSHQVETFLSRSSMRRASSNDRRIHFSSCPEAFVLLKWKWYHANTTYKAAAKYSSTHIKCLNCKFCFMWGVQDAAWEAERPNPQKNPKTTDISYVNGFCRNVITAEFQQNSNSKQNEPMLLASCINV